MDGITQPTGKVALRYQDRIRGLKVQFEEINFTWISSASANMKRALAWIGNQLSPEDKPIDLLKSFTYERGIHPCILEPEEANSSMAKENTPQFLVTTEDDWYEAIHRYYLCGDDMLFNQESQWKQIRNRALGLVCFNQTLYKRMDEGIWARYILNGEALELMHEVHEGLCDVYGFEPKMCFRIKRMGYYWPTMVADCLNSPHIHQTSNPSHSTVAS